MREKGKLPCLDFFSTCEISEEKRYTHSQWEGFSGSCFQLSSKIIIWHATKKNFLDVLIFYEEIIFIEITFFW